MTSLANLYGGNTGVPGVNRRMRIITPQEGDFGGKVKPLVGHRSSAAEKFGQLCLEITRYDKQEMLSCRLGSRRLGRRCSLIDKRLARPITSIALNESNLLGFQRCEFSARVKLPAVDSSGLWASNRTEEVFVGFDDKPVLARL